MTTSNEELERQRDYFQRAWKFWTECVSERYGPKVAEEVATTWVEELRKMEVNHADGP